MQSCRLLRLSLRGGHSSKQVLVDFVSLWLNFRDKSTNNRFVVDKVYGMMVLKEGFKDVNLSEVLSAKRRNNSVTQEELEAFIGVSKALVSKQETGSSLPDIMLFPSIAGSFDIAIDTLIGYTSPLGGR